MKTQATKSYMDSKRALNQIYDLYSRQFQGIQALRKVLALINLYNNGLSDIWAENIFSHRTFRKILGQIVKDKFIEITYYSPVDKVEEAFFQELIFSEKNANQTLLVNAYEVLREVFAGKRIDPKVIFEVIIEKLNIGGGQTGSFAYSSIFTSQVAYKEFFIASSNQNPSSFLELGSGLGNIMSNLIEDGSYDKITGIEINKEIYQIAVLYLNLFQKPFNLVNGDFFEAEFLEERSFTCVFADIPFDQSNISRLIYRSLDISSKKVVMVVPESLLFGRSSEYLYLRKHLIDSDLIEKVISLPVEANQPLTSFKTSILVLNKKKRDEETGFITFEEIDVHYKGFNMFTEDALTRTINGTHRVSILDVQKDELYRLNTNWHIKATELFSRTSDDIVKLLNICSIKTGQHLPKEEINELGDGIGFIQIRNLAKESDSPYLDPTSISQWVTERKKIIPAKHNDLLVSKIGDSLRPTLVREGLLAVSQNILIVRLNKSTDLLPEYLVHYLRSDEAKQQLLKLQTSGAFLRITKSNLEQFRIPVLSIEKQKDYINEAQEKFIGFQSRKAKQENISYIEDAASTLEHTLGNSLKVIEGQFNSIRDFFIFREQYDPILKPNTRLEIHEKSRLSNTLKRIEAELLSAKFSLENVNDWRKINKEDLRIELVELKPFFERTLDIIKEGTNIEIHLDCDQGIEYSIDKERFKILLRNFFNNARKHSFITPLRHVFAVQIRQDLDLGMENSLEEDDNLDKRNSLTIWIKNNGNPMEDDFNLEDHTKKGSNKGMKLIQNIVQAHSGSLRAIPSNEAQKYGANVVFEMNF